MMTVLVRTAVNLERERRISRVRTTANARAAPGRTGSTT